MSTESIFRQLGRLNESHTGIGPGKTREEYLRLFSRSSYSSENDWPTASPLAGFYDVKNSTTSLILLNQRHKFSHLRGKVLPRSKSRASDEKQEEKEEKKTFFEKLVRPDSAVEQDRQATKTPPSRVSIDPYRHFESILDGQNKYWHNRMCKGSHSVDNGTDYFSSDSRMTSRSRRRPRTASSFQYRQIYGNRSRSASSRPRARSATGLNEKWNEELKADPAFAQSLKEYYQFMKNKMQKPPTVGLEAKHLPEPASRRLRRSGIYRNPALTEGQKLYLLQKCHIYDIQNAKIRHKNSYLQVLNSRFKADIPACKFELFFKPEYRLHDPYEFVSYAKFVKTPRPTTHLVNTGYLTSKKPHQPRIPSGKTRQPLVPQRPPSHLDRTNFFVTSNPSFAQETERPRSGRISVDSLPRDDHHGVTFRLRSDSKSVPKIPVSSAKTDP